MTEDKPISNNAPTSIPTSSTIPPESHFTFVSGVSAPSFIPQSPFHYNTPQQKEEEREWFYAIPTAPREVPAVPPEPAPIPNVPTNRRIAPLPNRRMHMSEEKMQAPTEEGVHRNEATKEVKNAERMQKENSFLKEQLRRTYITIQNNKEEQLSKQSKIDDQQKIINNLKDTIHEVVRGASHYEQAFESQREVVAKQQKNINELLKEYDSITKILAQKMAEEEHKSKVEDNEVRATLAQEKNENLEKNKDDVEDMAANQSAIQIEELRNSIRILEQQNETLNTDFDLMRARLEASDLKLTETMVSYRQAQSTISNNNATIKDLEQQIVELGKEISTHRQEVAIRDSRIKSKDDEVRDAAAEVANLSSLNDQLLQENTRFKSQIEKLGTQARDYSVEIKVLREASRDHLELETALDQARASVAQLESEVGSLEHLNSQLKSRLEEYAPFARTGNSGRNLESELSQSDFDGADEESLSALDEGTMGGESQYAAPSAETPRSETPIEFPDMGEISDVTILPGVVTPQLATTPLEVTLPSEVTSPQETTTSPETISPSGAAQSSAVTSVPEGTSSQDVPASASTTQATLASPLPIAILKSHNPLSCWLQVYLDLWILVVFWLNQYLSKSPGAQSILSALANAPLDGSTASHESLLPAESSGDTADDLRGNLARGEAVATTPPPLSGAARRDVARAATTDAQASTDYAELEQELPDAWTTILAFGLHLLLLAVIVVCLSNYRAVLQERSIWLGANEMTRLYLHTFYKIHFRREYGMFHEVFGSMGFIDVWRYNVHSWAKISRSLPG